MSCSPASEFDLAALTELFNAGFSGYLVPMRLSEEDFSEHVALYDTDLGLSRVVVDDAQGEPVAFALVGRRGRKAWIAGMGTRPSHRRRGLGEKALTAAIQAAAASGCADIGLEVLVDNEPALRLYRKLGFEIVRDLAIWTLPPIAGQKGAQENAVAETIDVGHAQAWISAHRSSPEPWQRADETLEALKRRGRDLHGLVSRRDGDTAAAAVVREQPEIVAVMQIAALDEDAARSLLLAAAGGRTLRLPNVPIHEPASQALEKLGADHFASQHEMTLRVS